MLLALGQPDPAVAVAMCGITHMMHFQSLAITLRNKLALCSALVCPQVDILLNADACAMVQLMRFGTAQPCTNISLVNERAGTHATLPCQAQQPQSL